MLNDTELENYSRLAKALAAQFGSDCEVLIHAIGDDSLCHSIVAIENGHVTGRKIGDGPSGVVLEQLKSGDSPDDRLNYFTKTADGKILKSSTVYLKDSSGKVQAIFSINYDISRLSMVSDAVSELISSQESKEEAPAIVRNVSDLLDDLIDRSVKLVGKPVSLMTKSDKVRAIHFLNQNGALLVTKSGDIISKFFGISKYTLYSYLDEKQEESAHD